MLHCRAHYVLLCGILTPLATAQNWTWRGTAPLNQPRSQACAVRLADDRILVSGGLGDAPLTSTEIYQPAPREQFTEAAPLSSARVGPGCAVLRDGRVLVAGGGAASIELYEPTLNTWTTIEPAISRGPGATVTALPDGRALITGGNAIDIEVFNADNSSLTVMPATLTLRNRHTVTVLRDNRVLFAGGVGDQGPLDTAEILDPDSGEVRPAASLSRPRANHTATALLDGRVLIAGGADGDTELNTLEVWSPDTQLFRLLPATLQSARQSHTAILPATNGFVLITGGLAGSQALATSELFDPSSNTVQPGGSLTAARSDLAAVILADGTILATGGRTDEGPSRACGILGSPSFRFTQTVYHPAERAIVSGTAGISTANGRISLSLVQIDATGKSISANGRLISTFGSLVNGNLGATPIVDLVRADIGSSFVLTLTANVTATQTVTAQIRFSVKLVTTLLISSTNGAIIASQPVPTVTTLTADGNNVTLSGTLNISAGSASTAKAFSASAVSFTTNTPVCCPGSGGTTSVSGTIPLTASYGGNLFLEPSTASNTQIVLTGPPTVSLSLPSLLLTSPASIRVDVSLNGPPTTNTTPPIDPNVAPTGFASLTVGNTVFSAPLQRRTNTASTTYPASQASFTYTPTLVDRRAGNICFSAGYSGDTNYPPGSPITGCTVVRGAPTRLQAVTPPPTYTFGAATTITARLTWPNSVGIVGRDVDVSADGKTAGTLTLTPDPTGLGLAQGSASLLLPFNTRNVTLRYSQNGDLLGSIAGFPLTMNPILTTVILRGPSATANPFSLSYTISINTQGLTIPAGTTLGGSIQVRDNGTLIQSLTPPAVPTPTTLVIGDGSSNTIQPTTLNLFGNVTGLILPVGQHTITVQYTGGPQFQASQGQINVTVQ